MFDPRETPTATEAMLSDADLKAAIQAVRIRSLTLPADLGPHTALREELERRDPGIVFPWPFVEYLCDTGGRSAWAVDDRGVRYVVVGPTVFAADEMALIEAGIRSAAASVFARLDAGAA